jgi:hypothetical protein
MINAHYNQRLFSQRDLTSTYEANTYLALPNAGRRSVRALFLCNHNIHGSGLQRKKSLALIVCCVDYPLRCTYSSSAIASAIRLFYVVIIRIIVCRIIKVIVSTFYDYIFCNISFWTVSSDYKLS